MELHITQTKSYQAPPLNLDLANLETDHNYAKRAKDTTNNVRVHARTF